MLKETVTYIDYNGVERTEDFYFNYTEAELMEKELTTTGGLAEMIQKIVDSKDAPAIVKTFKELVLDAYGVKAPDGRKFIKNEIVKEDFAQCPAYSIIFMKLATDADAAARFVNGIMPDNLGQGKAPALAPVNN